MYVALADFIAWGHMEVRQGEQFADDHHLVGLYPDKFRKIDDGRPDVEDATAEPGRKRGE